MSWTFRSRAPSDWSYVFNKMKFEDAASARAYFDKMKAHATEHGGAGSLHNENERVDTFNIWCPND